MERIPLSTIYDLTSFDYRLLADPIGCGRCGRCQWCARNTTSFCVTDPARNGYWVADLTIVDMGDYRLVYTEPTSELRTTETVAELTANPAATLDRALQA